MWMHLNCRGEDVTFPYLFRLGELQHLSSLDCKPFKTGFWCFYLHQFCSCWGYFSLRNQKVSHYYYASHSERLSHTSYVRLRVSVSCRNWVSHKQNPPAAQTSPWPWRWLFSFSHDGGDFSSSSFWSHLNFTLETLSCLLTWRNSVYA